LRTKNRSEIYTISRASLTPGEEFAKNAIHDAIDVIEEEPASSESNSDAEGGKSDTESIKSEV